MQFILLLLLLIVLSVTKNPNGNISGPKRATRDAYIHSKSENFCGVCLSVSKHLRKKCANLDDNILRQRCGNHTNSKNFVSKGHFCWGYTLCKCLNLRFKQWLNIIWVILQFYLWKQWNLDSFCILSQSFCGKFKIICGVWTPGSPTFRT